MAVLVQTRHEDNKGHRPKEAPVPKAQLKQQLEALRAEIDALEDANQPVHARLMALADDIEKQLEDEEDESLVERVQDAVREYEVEHPRTTGVLNQILMTLSNMGI
jgi:Skp family chaperone for outer membrane proteins